MFSHIMTDGTEKSKFLIAIALKFLNLTALCLQLNIINFHKFNQEYEIQSNKLLDVPDLLSTGKILRKYLVVGVICSGEQQIMQLQQIFEVFKFQAMSKTCYMLISIEVL